ncbi:hypothetical protein V1283_000421 [Bradyrhizobium sp. AZCC 2262]
MANFTRSALVPAALLVAVLAMQSSPARAQSPSPTPLEECVECYSPTPDPEPIPDALGFAVSDAKPDIDAARQHGTHQHATGDRIRFERRLD